MRHLTQHVRDRMTERGVTEADVDWAMNHQSRPPEPGLPGTIWVYGHTSGGGIIKVCVQAGDWDQVITVVRVR